MSREPENQRILVLAQCPPGLTPLFSNNNFNQPVVKSTQIYLRMTNPKFSLFRPATHTTKQVATVALTVWELSASTQANTPTTSAATPQTHVWPAILQPESQTFKSVAPTPALNSPQTASCSPVLKIPNALVDSLVILEYAVLAQLQVGKHLF